MLTRAEGVGPRLAARIVNELKTRSAARAGVGIARPHRALRRPRAPPRGRGRRGIGAGSISATAGARRSARLRQLRAGLGDGAALDALIRAGLQELGHGLNKGLSRERSGERGRAAGDRRRKG